MSESPDEWLRRMFEYEYCPECGGDEEDHVVTLVLGNYFAWCKKSPFSDTNGETASLTLPKEGPRP